MLFFRTARKLITPARELDRCLQTVTTPPDEQARSIFDDLGYSLAGDGAEFSATRDWKEIRVRAVTDDVADAHDESGYRCFVTWADQAAALERELERLDPPDDG